ncbi:MAG TPA: amidohydrolase family protein [Terriglobales bacterium]|nr:amidohydrolase family protein [Terriglobales bacterium]
MIAIRAGLLIDGRGGQPLKNGLVLVGNDGRITKVGDASKIPIPSGSDTIEAQGRTILPGLFDSHCHMLMTTHSLEKRLFIPNSLEILKCTQTLKRTLHAGITTLRDAFGPSDVGLRQAVEMGIIEGPRLVMAGAIAQTGGHLDGYYPRDVELPFSEGFTIGPEFADGVPAVQLASRRILRKGFDFIKVCTSGGITSPSDLPEYTEWTMEELRAIVYEASARGKAVMAHAEGNRGIKNAVLAGVWSVEHGSMLDDEAIRLLLDRGTYLVPTLTAIDALANQPDKFGLTEVARSKVEVVARNHFDSFRKAAAAGIKIATGTDNIEDWMHGKNARELELMVRHGFTPMQTIVAATKVSSEACRVDDKVGTLEPGKQADLLVVDGNPLEDITILQDQSKLLLVMKDGKDYVNRT